MADPEKPIPPCDMAVHVTNALQQYDMSPRAVIEVEHRGRKTRWTVKRRDELEQALEYWERKCSASKGVTLDPRYKGGVFRCTGR